MSGIFKGDSIYKSGGGGGGGYKDGGQLTPAEYITVKNNVIAEYDNSADEINFIIEDDGNPHNSIIQVSTSVNATVNVYEIRNGFYYLLGVVGSNTINAGDDYTVNIIGNSYVVENVTQQSSDPAAAEIDGGVYGLKKINNLLWTTENVHSEQFGPLKYDQTNYYYWSFGTIDGWRLPTETEIFDLFNSYTTTELKSTSGWVAAGGGNGNNNSGMNFKPLNNWNPYDTPPGPYTPFGYWATCMYLKNGSYLFVKLTGSWVTAGNDAVNVRLVHDV